MITLDKKKVLLLVPPILSVSMICIFRLATERYGRTIGFMLGFCVYWFAFCLPTCLYIIGSTEELKRIYQGHVNNFDIKRLIYHIAAFIPCIATFCIIFYGLFLKVEFHVLGIALLFALVNGTIEELFWRGNYLKIFGNNFTLAYIYPSMFFGAWHIGLFFAKGIIYHGGLPALVGGALFMGLLWGIVSYRTRSIGTVTLAHIVTNFFAFTGLIYDNWYS
ncbi:CPBP family intramembrane glutamic endopeptidase [Vallitalea okinawensis]|uniref:CPBP family intramembrane glutamic endopeptidase n=1 Tax=Vallitalea okinawensis TaxID=2078660 RepID=UPI000CFB1B89|nr:CPBP family intramembrane glutamic endopeptidase [Vallitalea okinawensis]